MEGTRRMNAPVQIAPTIVRVLGVALAAVVPEARLSTDLGADDLERIEIVISLEANFNIEIGDDEIETIETVGDLTALVERKTAK